MALTYTMKANIPKPKGDLFDHEAFWTDSLLKALLARRPTKVFMPGEEDEAFTVMLMSDISLPVLLCVWNEYYQPIIERWKNSDKRLSVIEREDFHWDHAQAGAWILKSWKFPDEIVHLTGVHTLPLDEIKEMGLNISLALPLSVASLLPSILRYNRDRAQLLIDTTCNEFSLTYDQFKNLIIEVQERFVDIRDQFALKNLESVNVIDEIISICGEEK